MRRSKPNSEFAIKSPCTEAWDEMTGTATKRHCESCQKQVHNFAAMTPRQIDRLIADNQGHLCARITRRSDGSLVTAQELPHSGFGAKAAGIFLSAALSATAARAESTPGQGKAVVSGRFTAASGGPPPSQGYVVFAADGKSVLETKTDQDGNWKAEIAPGSYDVIFRTGPMFGERVNGVDLHAGEQEFPAIHGHIAFGHLGLVDGFSNTYTTVGEVSVTYHYPISYLFKHPIRYLKHLPHNFA
jgi:hypothetical protein